MSEQLGATRWAIPEGYLPAWSEGPEPEMTSHGAVCLLNAGAQHAHVLLTLYFEDRDPAGPYQIDVPARRTAHVRFNQLTEPEPVPTGTSFASVLESDVPVVVQHSRLDSRQAANALMTTIAYASG